MIFQEIVFWLIAVVAVGSALLMVHVRDTFRAALLLALTFLCVAGLFVLLNAEFLAVAQVLIYVGAVSVLIIFAVMLTRDVQKGNLPSPLRPLALLLGSLVLAALLFTIFTTQWPLRSGAGAAPLVEAEVEKALTGSTEGLADLLLSDFVLPFEVASVLLLAVIIGSLALVREREGKE